MKIERLLHFVNELEKNATLLSQTLSSKVAWWFDGRWWCTDSSIDDENVIHQLNLTKKSGSHRRETNSTYSYFYINDLDAVVISEFDSPTKKETRERVSGIIKTCLEHALNAYAARHDPLTGLLNRFGLEESFGESIRKHSMPEKSTHQASEAKGSPSLSMIAFDIDHFKQVNDTHGHQYGDLVLKSFAQHIEKLAKQLVSPGDSNSSVIVARPGGEEFSIVISGNYSRDKIKEFAEFLRKEVESANLPSDVDLQKFGADIDDVPHISDRKVTTSVGISISGIPLDIEKTSRQVLASLISQSDAALYRAKSGGRNLVRDYADILEKYGRVLEHHTDTHIVAIDIGGQVGVEVGQEFLVYHPDFSGGVPFYYTDGRTRKRIGHYPRHPMARITVMNVQPEMAFCSLDISGNPNGSKIPTGSWLQAIPLGSIGHLVSTEDRASLFDGVFEDSSTEEVTKFVLDVVDRKNSPVVIAFGIDSVDALRKSKGVAYINKVLATLFSAIRSVVKEKCKIGQFGHTKFVVAFEESDNLDVRDIAQQIINNAKTVHGAKVVFYGGFFRLNESRSEDVSGYDPRNAVEMALYTLTDEARVAGSNDIIEFGAVMAREIIYSHRKAKKYSKAIADYKNLRSLGIKDAYFENQASLSALESDEPDFEFAMVTINRAIDLKPDEGIFYANAGLIQYDQGNYDVADNWFKFAGEADEKFEYPDSYLGPYAASAVHTSFEIGVITKREKELLDLALSLDSQKHVFVSVEELASLKQQVDARLLLGTLEEE